MDDVAGEEPFAEFVALRDVGVVRIDLVLDMDMTEQDRQQVSLDYEHSESRPTGTHHVFQDLYKPESQIDHRKLFFQYTTCET